MFCLGCGAETPPNADRCPVCGREVTRIPGEPGASGSDHAAIRAQAATSATAAGLTATTLPTPSIAGGELDTPGFPRDAAGRALLVTVLAMMLDLLAPWVNQYGQRVAPAEAGAPVLLAVIVLALALVPLSRPSLRRQPVAAVLPIVAGSLAFGATAVIWARPALLGNPALYSGGVIPAGGAIAPYPVADIGLYLFLFGAGILVYTGYQLFLAAARSSVLAGVLSPVPAPLVAAPRPTGGAEDATERGESANGHAPGLSGALAAQVAERPAAQAIAAPARVAAQELTLPGTAGWNTAPSPPHVARPAAGGWRRQGNPRHP